MDLRSGRALRAIRHHLGWRQIDVAERAGVSQAAVSLAERGHLEAMPIRRVHAIAAALDARVAISIRWQGGDLDRLLDEGHAVLVGRVADVLSGRGWNVRPEVSFSIYGERGSIDLLAWHAATESLLVVEVKTELTSVEETIRRHDTKVRLAPTIAAERFGWYGRDASRLLVLPNAATPRRRVARHESVLSRAYPTRGDELRAWLREPGGDVSGLLFVSSTHPASGRRSALARKRIRRSVQVRRKGHAVAVRVDATESLRVATAGRPTTRPTSV